LFNVFTPAVLTHFFVLKKQFPEVAVSYEFNYNLSRMLKQNIILFQIYYTIMEKNHILLLVFLLFLAMPYISGGPAACLSCIGVCAGAAAVTGSLCVAIAACFSNPATMVSCLAGSTVHLGVCGVGCAPVCLAPTP